MSIPIKSTFAYLILINYLYNGTRASVLIDGAMAMFTLNNNLPSDLELNINKGNAIFEIKSSNGQYGLRVNVLTF